MQTVAGAAIASTTDAMSADILHAVAIRAQKQPIIRNSILGNLALPDLLVSVRFSNLLH